MVKKGDSLKPGLKIAEMEADKAAFDLSCPLEGTLAEILVPVGDMVKVGTPLLKVATGTARVSKKLVTLENREIQSSNGEEPSPPRDRRSSPPGTRGRSRESQGCGLPQVRGSSPTPRFQKNAPSGHLRKL